MKNSHNLKIKKCFLERLVSKEKTCEIRFNDRDYQAKDILCFNEEILYEGFTDLPEEVIGRVLRFEITHVLNSSQFPEGLKENYCILSLKKL